MGQTMRDLGSTIKEAKGINQNSNKNKSNQQQDILEDEYAEDFESSHQHQESMN